jgi:addiction module RelE/StbE family toxin
MRFRRSHTFVKQYQNLPPKIQAKFDARLRLWLVDRANPQLRVHPLKGSKKGYWSLSISGDLRALYYFENEDLVVFVLIGTHSQLY